MCLDIFNGGPNNNQPHLVNCANFSGQFWNIMVTESGDAVRLTTIFRGPSMCLDIFNGGPNNNQPHLAECGNFTGQLWVLTKQGFIDWPTDASGMRRQLSPAADKPPPQP